MTLIITADDGTEVAVAVVPIEPSDSQLADGAWEWHFRRGPGSVYNKMLAAADPSLLGAVIEMRRVLAANSEALGFLASVVKSGEPWTDTCQSKYDSAREKACAALSRIREATDEGK